MNNFLLSLELSYLTKKARKTDNGFFLLLKEVNFPSNIFLYIHFPLPVGLIDSTSSYFFLLQLHFIPIIFMTYQFSS